MGQRSLKEIDISDKSILVRLDLDVPVLGGQIVDDARLLETLPTVQWVINHGASRVSIIGHLGRPRGSARRQYSLDPVRAWYRRRFAGVDSLQIEENLRFDSREEENNFGFASEIVRRIQAQVYVFDAFGVSHREHTSVVTIPRLLPTVTGFRFEAEIAHLEPVLRAPKRPLVYVIGGIKLETKTPLVEALVNKADAVLVGGTLPTILSPKPGLFMATLTQDTLDITEESAKLFSEKIRNANTVVWNGPMGAYERNEQTNKRTNEQQLRGTAAWGTYVVAKAVSETKAYTVVGGGDTEAALNAFGITSGIDWISSGGGAMLYYLAYRTLPFLEMLK